MQTLITEFNVDIKGKKKDIKKAIIAMQQAINPQTALSNKVLDDSELLFLLEREINSYGYYSFLSDSDDYSNFISSQINYNCTSISDVNNVVDEILKAAPEIVLKIEAKISTPFVLCISTDYANGRTHTTISEIYFQ